ncbi:hypothetical protein H9L15_03485 [Sphingomonas daechungensis]|uniref:Peptidase M13 N-terminal domain-containing protein n=1 Tax=Sphingomonas daechungensis TaxID=1176646 RepID=A0ABX6T3Z5_9SPHN|nr:M13 family metallopeptidase [Sphingomonas daechungensis]QNP43740.1 hypothetical protein H9L15_03485 [Sphingomonas daechungensis]
MRKRWIAIILACAAAAPTAFAAQAGVVAAGPDQLAFSKQNMDTSVSPSTDFYRYAAGSWLKRVKRPEQHPGYGFFEIVLDQVQQQMNVLLAKAAADAPNASSGTPAQQVGTLYNAYMNTAARNAAGIKPIQPFLEKGDAIKDLDGLAAYLAQNEIDGGRASSCKFPQGRTSTTTPSHRCSSRGARLVFRKPSKTSLRNLQVGPASPPIATISSNP